jgi:hypothetical protein
MNCSNCFLLIRRLESVSSDGEYPANLPETDQYLTRFAAQGHVKGQTAYLAADLPPMASSVLRTTGKCFSRWPWFPHQASQVLVQLATIDTSELASLKHDGGAPWRHRVIEGVFGSEVGPYSSRRFHSILYLEASESLGNYSVDDETLLSLIKQLRDDTGESGSGCISQAFEDLLLLPSVLGGPSRDLIALRPEPLTKQSDGVLGIPQALLRLADIIELVHRLEDTDKQLRAHSFLSETASEYVSRLLSPKRPPLNALRWRGWKRVVESYDKHLSDRLDGIHVRQAATRLSQEYTEAAEELARNAKAKQDDWLWTSNVLSSSPYSWGIVAHLRSDLERTGSRVYEAVHEMEARDAAIGDYVRDYLAAAGASSNMTLQRAVFWLAVLALIIAILSLWRS